MEPELRPEFVKKMEQLEKQNGIVLKNSEKLRKSMNNGKYINPKIYLQ